MITREFEGLVLKSGSDNVRIDVLVALTFDEEYDPFAVQILISADGEPDAVWYVSRELLQRGVNSLGPVGNGDIRFRYSGTANGRDALYVCLRNLNGHADLSFPHHEVIAFLNETTDAALQGIGCLDTIIDEAILDILNG